MPLTAIQQSVAEVLRSHRSERSYVAGGAALNPSLPTSLRHQQPLEFL